jgi:putative ABC transport system substrate-binding protein
MKKTTLLSILVVAVQLSVGVMANAQQPKKVPRIGYLSTGSRSSAVVEAFQQEVRDLGYIEGQNITIEYRSTEGMAERLPNLVAELVQLKVDIIVVGGSPATQAAKNATKTIPIVMTSATDPVGIGLVARPGAAQWKHHRVDQHCSAVFGNRDLGRYEGFCVDVYVSP